MSARPRILCLGMNHESAVALEALAGAGADIAGVAALPPGAAAGVSDFTDLAARARALGIAGIPVTDANDAAAREAFAAAGADVLFVLGWSQLLAPETCALFPLGAVGSHPSALPHGRGRAPVPWTILEDLRESAVTLFRIGPGVDDGAILAQHRFAIPERAYAGDLYDIVARSLGEAFVALEAGFAAGTVRPRPQEPVGASWRARRIPADGRIDFTAPAAAVDRLVRAVARPYPGAYSYHEGRRVIFWRAEPAGAEDRSRKGAPGQILRRRGGGAAVLVQAGDGPLWLGEPEIPGGGTVTLGIGTRLGYALEDELHALRDRVAALEAALARLGVEPGPC